MKTEVIESIAFGTGREGLRFQGTGWSAPEASHNWTLGPVSELVFPNVDAPRGYYIEAMCGPYLIQRLSVLANGVPVAECFIKAPGIFAWHAPAAVGQVTITFHHPDATRPCDVSSSGDNRLLALSIRRVRLLRILEVKPATTREHVACDLPDSELAVRFESIGDNCEFGLVQRGLDAEPLGLVRFSSAPIDRMVVGVDTAFSGITDGLEAFDGVPSGVEWSMHAPRYGMRWHTFVPQSSIGSTEIVERQSRTIVFLARKFMDDAASAEKIFVVKRNIPLCEHEVLPLFLALRRIGEANLLWISVMPERAGEVDVLQPGLLRGYLSRCGDPSDIAGTLRAAEWLRVMRAAVQIVN